MDVSTMWGWGLPATVPLLLKPSLRPEEKADTRAAKMVAVAQVSSYTTEKMLAEFFLLLHIFLAKDEV